MSEASPGEATPVIGKPSPPPEAVVVAVSGRFTAMVRAARFRRFLRSLVVVGVFVGLAVGAVVVAEAVADAARPVLLIELTFLGAILFAGAVVRPRPLEVGVGLLARGAEGKFAPLAAGRELILVLPAALRAAFDGLLHTARLIRHDPAAELAAWIVLALGPPHGPAGGEWVSLEGVGAAGLYSLPDDLKPALEALRSHGWIAVDRGRYPPRARLEEAGREFVRELVGGRS
ncbi:MAG: hypothetical protein ACYTFI_17925 [Planctomycetota bacterium]|jgi:hypothetical protein